MSDPDNTYPSVNPAAAHPADLKVSTAWYSKLPLVAIVICIVAVIRELRPLSAAVESGGRDTFDDVLAIAIPVAIVIIFVVLILTRLKSRARTKRLRERFPSAAIGVGIWARATRSVVPEKRGGNQANSFGLVITADGIDVWEDTDKAPLVRLPRADVAWIRTAVIRNGNRSTAGLIVSSRSRGDIPLILTDPDRRISSYLRSAKLHDLAVQGRGMLGLR
ncbi:hypothetical protein [Frondihabitans cladoniiphilus]|uniref:Uncharacterized protein n=1 Tax=Frondihabitans cladoniiphilus TaxID=715785 RepID=A0ABP8VP94_9MICO